MRLVRLWAYFSGSFDVLMNELLLQLFELPRHKPLLLALLAMFVRQPLFLSQRSKHRKITETLLLEKVRVLKKSSLVVFFKHGSNPSDSLLELNVVKNNRNTVIAHLLFNFLPAAGPRLLWALSLLLRALSLYREDSVFDSLFKTLDALLDALTDDLLAAMDAAGPLAPPLRRLRRFALLLRDCLVDPGFKEFVWEHFLVDKFAETLLALLEHLLQAPPDSPDWASAAALARFLARVLSEALDPFRGFDFPNSKVPKKFNGDHLLLRKSALARSARRAAVLGLAALKKARVKSAAQALPWLALLESLSGTQTGRCLLLFAEGPAALAKEKPFAVKRSAALSAKEALEKLRGDGFPKLEFKFGSHLRSAVQALAKPHKPPAAPRLALAQIDFLVRAGRLALNLLLGDDHDLKGLSGLRVYFLQKAFFKKKSLWEATADLKGLFEALAQRWSAPAPALPDQLLRRLRRETGLGLAVFAQLAQLLGQYPAFSAKRAGLGKLFRKKPKWKSSKKARDFGRREDEKFKLRLQKFNQTAQRLSAGKLPYEDDNIAPYLSDLEFFQPGPRSAPKAALLGEPDQATRGCRATFRPSCARSRPSSAPAPCSASSRRCCSA